MDKTPISFNNVKHKEGFALMVTLSVLAVLIALTMVLLSYFEEVQEDAADTTALIQADVYYSDITTIFDKFKKKKDLFSRLYLFPVPLLSEDGRFTLLLRCSALSNGANINWLAMEKNNAMQDAYSFSQTVFDFLTQEYNLQDASRLYEMLIAEIEGKEEFTKNLMGRLRQKKGIISYKQFAQIVSRYQLEVDDPQVSQIPWEKYFTFSSNAKVIDAEYSSAELLSLLFDLDVQALREWQGQIEDKSTLESFVRENGGNYKEREKLIAGKEFLEESQCTVAYQSAERQYNFRFEYIQGEAKHFEFYGNN
ncbi:MAG TPA: hypothetical protein EYG82_04365 [Sulfurovum sp.]|nr:hypothetical protein [Sulfurovum sp.]